MQEWWVGYYSKFGQNAPLEQHKPGQKPNLEEFARISLEGRIGERDFMKMWIVDYDPMPRRIVAFCGSVPPAAMRFHGGGAIDGTTKLFPMTTRRDKEKPRR